MKNTYTFMVLIVLMVFIAACSPAVEEAEESFEGFIGVFDGGGFSEITKYITDDFAQREFGVSLEQIEEDSEVIDEQMGEIIGTYDYTIVTFDVTEETEEQIKAVYEIYITERNGDESQPADEQEYSQEELETGIVTIVNEDGSWLVDDMDENP
ncbi:hypothetical protein [Alteribacter natronophilus]|uniref:hypothetical protein n=1 Tax=Alteribacter natronophilus TaxID=2583810 RepID=UPI00110D7D43|nr:hypothetical protein [Alteribacter natronophilus]TMW70436.1 hypothetical protein FGB90_17370 [Alteribacter natronophilus]